MDVVILGGGIVGLTMANLLTKHQNLQIAVVDPNIPVLEWDVNLYDLRCSAITSASQNIFTDIGIWEEIINNRAGMYDQMLVWDRDPEFKVQFSANSIGAQNLGHIIENRVIHAALYKKLLQQNNVEFFHQSADEFFGTHTISCNLTIGADGMNSWLRAKMNIGTYGWDYQHHAIVATIKTQLPHHNTARQRFMPDGPLAFLPLADPHLCSIVWSSSPNRIKDLMQLDANQFCVQLAEEFSVMLGSLELHGSRASFPLRMQHAQNYVAAGVALIGDAAHVIHPLAGQGLNLGILDAAALDDVVGHALQQQKNIGHLHVLRKYERQRKGHNLSIITLMEALKRLFASKQKTITSLRTQGMHLLNNLDLCKNLMMRYACG